MAEIVVDKVEGDPALYRRPYRESEMCGRCGAKLVLSPDDGRLICPDCGYQPWVLDGTTIRF